MTKRKTKPKPKKSNSQLVLVPIKIHPKEIRAMKALAKRYCDGNFSAWLRTAGLRYRPSRTVHVKIVPRKPVRKKR